MKKKSFGGFVFYLIIVSRQTRDFTMKFVYLSIYLFFLRLTYTVKIRGVFRTQSNIYCGAF